MTFIIPRRHDIYFKMPTFNKYNSFKVLYYHKILFSPSSHMKIRDTATATTYKRGDGDDV